MQKVSKDDGISWGNPVDITHFIDRGCNQGPGGQVCGAAGSRVATSSGRLVFAGHSSEGVCVWYSDDGGATYQVNKGGMIVGNEISIADLGGGNLYMNGRGTNFAWAGTRESTLMAHPLRFWLTQGPWWVAPTPVEGAKGVGAPRQCPPEVGSKLPLTLYADVRLHIPMTHRNGRYFILEF